MRVPNTPASKIETEAANAAQRIRAGEMNEEDREFEHSPLSGTFRRDGEAVDVEIYRYVDTQDPWQLTVIDLSSGRCTTWQKPFTTEREAYHAFTAMIDARGIALFVDQRPGALN